MKKEKKETNFELNYTAPKASPQQAPAPRAEPGDEGYTMFFGLYILYNHSGSGFYSSLAWCLVTSFTSLRKISIHSLNLKIIFIFNALKR